MAIMSCNLAMFLRCLAVTVIYDLSFEVSNILNGDLIPEPGMFFFIAKKWTAESAEYAPRL